MGMCHVAMLKVPKQRKGRRLCMAQWEWGPGMYLTLRSHLFQFNLLHISQFPLSCGPLITLFEKIAPSVNDIRADPSHGSNRAEKYSYKAFRSESIFLSFCHASGIIIMIASGRLQLARTRSSRTSSKAPE